jgi:hypothetical protein
LAPPLSLASAPRAVTRAVWLAGLTSLNLRQAGQGDRDRTERHRNFAFVVLRPRHAGHNAPYIHQEPPGFGRRQRHIEGIVELVSGVPLDLTFGSSRPPLTWPHTWRSRAALCIDPANHILSFSASLQLLRLRCSCQIFDKSRNSTHEQPR